MLSDCNLFEIETFFDSRGKLSFLQEDQGVSFPIKRIYYLYDTKATHVRGVHAHHKLEQVIVALYSKFEVKLDDGKNSKIVVLDKPNLGLYVSRMIWREVIPIENNGICMVLASRKYEEEDYIHDYKDFISLAR
jgi:dTDP-4-dehydrorhamnose 3,5-epimerase-like enzyme